MELGTDLLSNELAGMVRVWVQARVLLGVMWMVLLKGWMPVV
jgi:hypothetical protein